VSVSAMEMQEVRAVADELVKGASVRRASRQAVGGRSQSGPARLRGVVRAWLSKSSYGFITVHGVMDEKTGRPKQWHFHLNAVRVSERGEIATGSTVEFTPKRTHKPGLCDVATLVRIVAAEKAVVA
jgi:hypothetical protein